MSSFGSFKNVKKTLSFFLFFDLENNSRNIKQFNWNPKVFQGSSEKKPKDVRQRIDKKEGLDISPLFQFSVFHGESSSITIVEN